MSLYDWMPRGIVILLEFALLLLAVAASVFIRRKWVRSRFGNTLPRPLLTATVWVIPCAMVWLALLPTFRHINDALEIAVIVPVAFVLGGLYGLCFALLARFGKADARWTQRMGLGAAMGLALALLIGILVHQFLTGWGGPGGGGFVRPGVFEVALVFSWLAPALAVVGLVTPKSALVRAAAP